MENVQIWEKRFSPPTNKCDIFPPQSKFDVFFSCIFKLVYPKMQINGEHLEDIVLRHVLCARGVDELLFRPLCVSCRLGLTVLSGAVSQV